MQARAHRAPQQILIAATDFDSKLTNSKAYSRRCAKVIRLSFKTLFTSRPFIKSPLTILTQLTNSKLTAEDV